MKINYVLIDYENVQPEDLSSLDHEHFRVVLFLGPNQTKIPVEIVLKLHAMGTRARIVQCSNSGKNALDFHIAFYCGEIAAADPTAYLHIVSKDTGFDPLISHIRSRKISASRVNSIEEMPTVKISRIQEPSGRADFILTHFQKVAAKPRTRKTLSSLIATQFQKTLGESEIELIVKELIRRKVIVINGEKVEYPMDAA